MNVSEKAARYIDRANPAIEGQGGSTACYTVAQALAVGFALSDDAAWLLLCSYNAKCVPPFSESELRHKLKSARKDSRKSPGYLLGERRERRAHASAAIAKKESEPPISDADYTAVATAFLAECGEFHGMPDNVRSYLGKRLLVVEGKEAGLVGLPSRPREIIKRLGKTFSAETLEAAGLWSIAYCSFPRPEYSLIIPWLGLDGSVHRIQRRHIDQENIEANAPKYRFPKGLKPLYPFGCEALRNAPKDAPIVFCEGALDVLALRTIRRWDRMSYAANIIPLGVPGSGWEDKWAEYARGREAWIALDSDKAGEALMKKTAKACHEANVARVIRWRPPAPFKDWAQALEGSVK